MDAGLEGLEWRPAIDAVVLVRALGIVGLEVGVERGLHLLDCVEPGP